MVRNPIHIVCLDAPSPPDYGGAIDMYYKVKELSKTFDIILHYFDYHHNRNTAGLQGHCREVYSYSRKSFPAALPISKPYIIASRINKELIERLNADAYPVLLEGIHCSGILPYLNGKKVVIRMHNEEAAYYHRLAKTEHNIFKKIFFLNESRLLKKYQNQMKADVDLACVSLSDIRLLENKFEKTHLHYIPSFTPWQKIDIAEGSGEYCLYHGNLEVAENLAVAEWLIRNVVDAAGVPFIIAGKGAKSLRTHKNLKTIDSPSNEELDQLIRNAHINVLPSLNTTGLKLKMLHALFTGRHCLTNSAAVAGTQLENAVRIAEDAAETIAEIKRIMQVPFTKELAEQREYICDIYSNEKNAAKLSALLY